MKNDKSIESMLGIVIAIGIIVSATGFFLPEPWDKVLLSIGIPLSVLAVILGAGYLTLTKKSK